MRSFLCFASAAITRSDGVIAWRLQASADGVETCHTNRGKLLIHSELPIGPPADTSVFQAIFWAFHVRQGMRDASAGAHRLCTSGHLDVQM